MNPPDEIRDKFARDRQLLELVKDLTPTVLTNRADSARSLVASCAVALLVAS